ncbi:hypothetical protein TH63_07510 [Rufibacter radiotolerans]|uniref:Uncharacterized protein n=2 Tax=Rufibacter radiotolerans TaxID=1379910 RepID=A0A0H4W522_9BACT|nr:hypothetical protein TH63_07510 [Rufibacter radiotolerans]
MIHLSSLTALSVLPVAHAGVAVKKVCPQQETKLLLHKAVTERETVISIIQPTESSQTPEAIPEGKLCSVKVLCTLPAPSSPISVPHFLYHQPHFKALGYTSFLVSFEPDPPQVG